MNVTKKEWGGCVTGWVTFQGLNESKKKLFQWIYTIIVFKFLDKKVWMILGKSYLAMHISRHQEIKLSMASV